MASSAAAFVEGGVQDACEDACSICLENFRDADPAVVTCCKHEYHLQCIIEWSQRSKECPMCWQALSLKDPDSQELLAAVEQERSIRQSRINISGVFPPTEGYEFHRIASYGDDSDFEERMMRHLAFVTMGRRQLGRRDGNAVSMRPGYGNMQSQFVIVPAHGNAPSSGVSVPAGSLSLSPTTANLNSSPQGSPTTPDSGSSSTLDLGSSRSRGSPRVAAENNRRSSAEVHSFSETLKSRLAAASSRYKESLTKTTKSFRDKLRMRNGMADIGARAREVSAGVVRALERISLESPEKEGEDCEVSPASAHTSDVARSSNVEHSPNAPQVHESTGNTCSANGARGAVNTGSSKIVPQPVTDGQVTCLEDRRPKNIEGSTGPALEGQQMHLVPT